MDKGKLPTWSECRAVLREEEHVKKYGNRKYDDETKRMPTELHRFIYEEEPADIEEAVYFRERLVRLINFLTKVKNG